jgi:hypothetical protein
MKKFIFLFFFVAPYILLSQQQSNNFTIDLARDFSKDIFELNGVPFLQPVVKVVNTTSNTGFFYDAFVPKQVSTPCFKFTIQMMYGITPESEKTYTPQMPNQPFNANDIGKYYNIATGKLDTAGLIHYFFLNLMYDGMYGNHKGLIEIPKSAPTALGNKPTSFEIRKGALDTLVKSHPAYPIIQQLGLEDTVMHTIETFPNIFDLPPGGNINSIVAGVPQLVIGSYLGSELLIRFVPTINLGTNIGNFNFWGLGLKHSISQYFESPIDIAVQAVYQSTNLNNKVGVTNAELNANAKFVNVNLELSKSWDNLFTFYTALSYENVNIESTYKYYLPVVVQWQLGMLEQGITKPTPGYPGDQNPQTAQIKVQDSQMRFTFGFSKEISNIIFSLDGSVTKMFMFGFSLGYKF